MTCSLVFHAVNKKYRIYVPIENVTREGVESALIQVISLSKSYFDNRRYATYILWAVECSSSEKRYIYYIAESMGLTVQRKNTRTRIKIKRSEINKLVEKYGTGLS